MGYVGRYEAMSTFQRGAAWASIGLASFALHASDGLGASPNREPAGLDSIPAAQGRISTETRDQVANAALLLVRQSTYVDGETERTVLCSATKRTFDREDGTEPEVVVDTAAHCVTESLGISGNTSHLNSAFAPAVNFAPLLNLTRHGESNELFLSTPERPGRSIAIVTDASLPSNEVASRAGKAVVFADDSALLRVNALPPDNLSSTREFSEVETIPIDQAIAEPQIGSNLTISSTTALRNRLQSSKLTYLGPTLDTIDGKKQKTYLLGLRGKPRSARNAVCVQGASGAIVRAENGFVFSPVSQAVSIQAVNYSRRTSSVKITTNRTAGQTLERYRRIKEKETGLDLSDISEFCIMQRGRDFKAQLNGFYRRLDLNTETPKYIQ